MFYYLYEIKNLINGKIYVGVHKTRDMNDGYMGSGKVILRAIEKHGTNNFKKVILEQFDNPAAMYAREKEVVNEDFLSRKDVYNLRRGGTGGFDYINKSTSYEDRSKRNKLIYKNTGGADRTLLANQSTAKLRENPEWFLWWKSTLPVQQTFLGKKHSSESKRAIGLANKKMVGDKNSQFGKMWITNGKQNLSIKKTESIPDGWVKGRKMKTKTKTKLL